MKYIIFVFVFLISSSCFASGWDSAKVELTKIYEKKYNLPHGICRAFNQKENSGKVDSAAVPRVEYEYFNIGGRHYKDGINNTKEFFRLNPDLVDSIPFEIERVQEAMSWGEWQLMGFNYRDLGCKVPYLSKLTFEQRLKYWAIFFSRYMKRYKTLERAVKMYNGPSAKASYTRDVLRYRKKFEW